MSEPEGEHAVEDERPSRRGKENAPVADRDGAAGRTHVTLQDVARRADVSPATASRVLNGTTQVRPDLRERVLAAAAALEIGRAHV